MSDYRRIYIPGGHYFFTVITWRRRPVFANEQNIQILRTALGQIRSEKPFAIDAIVILPDHLHCLFRLPENDADFSGRWREIKKYVARRAGQKINHRGEYNIWQRRFWEHSVRNENDWRRHMDYIHYNPVKHGLAQSPAQWPYSSFKTAVGKGWYPYNWGQNDIPESIKGMDLE